MSSDLHGKYQEHGGGISLAAVRSARLTTRSCKGDMPVKWHSGIGHNIHFLRSASEVGNPDSLLWNQHTLSNSFGTQNLVFRNVHSL